MEVFILIFIIFSLLITSIKPEPCLANCPTTRCSHGGPRIQFPFGVHSQQAPQCGCSGFELSCEGNKTKIHFSNYGSLAVKSISYDKKILNLADPKSCVHGVFLDLDLSLTSFRYFYVVNEYLYLNCTEKISSFTEVGCLSRSGYYVYVVKPSSMGVPRFCRVVKRVAVPFEYSPYLADDSFGLALTWDFDDSKTGCQGGCLSKPTNNQVYAGLGISLVDAKLGILMAAIIIIIIIIIKRKNHPKEEELAYQKLSLGPYESLHHHDSV